MTAAERIQHATAPTDVFGNIVDEETLKSTYRKLAAQVHPDHNPGMDPHVFAKLNELHEIARRSFKPFKPFTISIKSRSYTCTRLVATGDISDVYEAGDKAVKIVANPRDNDLMENEAKVLHDLYPTKQPSEKFYRYLPRFVETFKVNGRCVTVFERIADLVTLEDVHRTYPALDYRDAVWMFKRILASTGFAHTKGVVHGGLVPSNVLVHPIDHGAKIVGWCNANNIRSISPSYKSFYPSEAKGKITSATDIFMAAKIFVFMVGDKLPDRIQRFTSALLLNNPARRPSDAWALHEELDEILLQVVGKPKYRPLHMPKDTWR